MKIGIDIGNVIIGGGGDDTQFFGEDFLSTPEVEGAIESIARLTRAGHTVKLVSKCGDKVRDKTVSWLDHHNFWNRTRLIDFEDVYFVYHRGDKYPVAKALDLSIFIDDREDIIADMFPSIHGILFTSWDEVNEKLTGIL